MIAEPLIVQLAQRFDIYASDQIASQRWQSSARAKAECRLKATVWTDAANELRELAGRYDLIEKPKPGPDDPTDGRGRGYGAAEQARAA